MWLQPSSAAVFLTPVRRLRSVYVGSQSRAREERIFTRFCSSAARSPPGPGSLGGSKAMGGGEVRTTRRLDPTRRASRYDGVERQRPHDPWPARRREVDIGQDGLRRHRRDQPRVRRQRSSAVRVRDDDGAVAVQQERRGALHGAATPRGPACHCGGRPRAACPVPARRSSRRRSSRCPARPRPAPGRSWSSSRRRQREPRPARRRRAPSARLPGRTGRRSSRPAA